MIVRAWLTHLRRRLWGCVEPRPIGTCRHRAGGTGMSGCRIKVPRMQKWEYSTVPLLVHATKQILDNWGDDGWELVCVVPGPNPETLVASLKRPKPGDAR